MGLLDLLKKKKKAAKGGDAQTPKPSEYVLIDRDDRKFILHAGNNRIGRGTSSDVCMPPDAKMIARLHCMVIVEENRVLLMDTGALNGTFLNKKRIPVQEPEELRAGDVIHLGSKDYFLRLEKLP